MPLSGDIPSKSSLLELFQKIKEELNPFEVVIGGGEPFTRQDIVELLDDAGRIFRSVGVVTNGTLFSRLDGTADVTRLRRLSGDRGAVQVSLDSADPKANDDVRGSGESALKGLEFLEQKKIAFSVGIVVTSVNSNSLSNSLEFLIRRFKYLKGILLMNLMPSEILGDEYWDLRANKENYLSACMWVQILKQKHHREDLRLFTDSDNAEHAALIDEYHFPTCLAGLTKVEFLPNGDVTPCAIIRSKRLGNIYTEPWKKIWDRSLARFRHLEAEGIKIPQCYHYNLTTTAAPADFP